MELQITTFYVICRELLSALNIREDLQAKMNNAEVMTVVLTAARFFGGNFRTAALFLEEHGYITDMLSESRSNHRIHALDADIRETLFPVIPEAFKTGRNTSSTVFLSRYATISGSAARKSFRERSSGGICRVNAGTSME